MSFLKVTSCYLGQHFSTQVELLQLLQQTLGKKNTGSLFGFTSKNNS
jgi:hypothetical protein